MGYQLEMDAAGDVFIDILSLQEILPYDLYFFTVLLLLSRAPTLSMQAAISE